MLINKSYQPFDMTHNNEHNRILVDEHLSKLDPKERRILEMYYIEEKDMKTIASELGYKNADVAMEKYRAATEAMSNNPDGMAYTRVASISSNIKMNIQSYERGRQSSMSPECWDELQQIKSEFESMSISNQVQDNEPRDLDFDNVND